MYIDISQITFALKTNKRNLSPSFKHILQDSLNFL